MENAAQTTQSTSRALKVVTVNLSVDMIDLLNSIVSDHHLFPSRSEAIRYILLRGIPEVMDMAERMKSMTPELGEELPMLDLRNIPLDMRTIRNDTILGRTFSKASSAQ